jgi:hypothetical protein
VPSFQGVRFTASTSFANPAVTIARGFTDTFSGIQPGHAPGFILAVAATVLFGWLAQSAPAMADASEEPVGAL